MAKLLDFEAQSAADLKTVGGRLYCEHPRTTALCCAVFDTDSGDLNVWLPGMPRPFNDGDEIAAHNAMGFDRYMAMRLGWCSRDRKWIDTSELARRAGMPGALDAIGTRWCGVPKDKEASRFTASLSTLRRPKEIKAAVWAGMARAERERLGNLTAITPDVMARVVPYNILDVQIMADAWPRLEPWREFDEDVSEVDRIVNDRGVPFDGELAVALLECDAANTDLTIREAAAELGWDSARVREVAGSPKQITEELDLVDARKATITAIDHPLARARLALASIARGKLLAGINRVSHDGYMRDTHRYYGAHTGRWSGKGMQLQNLPRPAKLFEDLWKKMGLSEEQIDAWICSLADKVKGGSHIANPVEINLLLRSTICAPEGYAFAVCDFSGVEARANAWAAGDHPAVAMYREGKLDAYKVEASGIFGVPYDRVDKVQRHVGKIAILALGYGMGARKYNDTCIAAGVDLAAVGRDANTIVKAWRNAHAPIVKFWYDCERAFKRALEGKETQVSCFTFMPGSNGEVLAWLPSGRPIVYQEARLSSEGGPVFFDGQFESHIYGGLLVENLIQALCRDLMARCLVLAEDAGLLPVMHVHDEIVCMVPARNAREGYRELHQIMTSLPDWAEGFPMGAAGFHGRRYRK